MRRLLLIGVLTAGAALVGDTSAPAQPIDGNITYYHRQKNKEDTIKVTIIEESPGQIAYRISGRTEKLLAPDILDIEYLSTSALVRQDYRRALRYEDEIEDAADPEARKKAIQQAIDAYQVLLPKMTESRFAQRHIAWKMARLEAKRAEDNPSLRDGAIAALSKFLQEHGGGWQVGQASKLLAQMQLDKGDLAGAQQTFASLAGKPDLARETRQEYQLLSVRSLMRSGKYDEAQKQLRSIQALLLPDDKAMNTRTSIYLAGCQGMMGQLAAAEKPLQAVLSSEAEPSLKALACNLLAESYLKADRKEDAFWRFLMVDTLYNQDPAEQARALYHLSRLFEEVKKDTARAQDCRERLLKEKQYAGLEYRRLATQEK
jgi:hypothetical protein